ALVRELVRRTGLRRLALAGGCAFNSLANGRLLEATDVRELFVQAAAGDAGTALRAALYLEHAVRGRPPAFVVEHASWGPEHDSSTVRQAVAEALPGCDGSDGVFGDYRVAAAPSEDVLAEETAVALAAGEVVGWYQGRGEWGPRALGNRSILA